MHYVFHSRYGFGNFGYLNGHGSGYGNCNGSGYIDGYGSYGDGYGSYGGGYGDGNGFGNGNYECIGD